MSSQYHCAEVHHRELHRIGNERSWWDQLSIDPLPIALRFWQQTKGMASGASGQPTADSQIADASTEQEHEAGTSSNADLPPWSTTTGDNGTTR